MEERDREIGRCHTTDGRWKFHLQMGPQAKICRKPLEAGKDKEIGSSLESEWTQP